MKNLIILVTTFCFLNSVLHAKNIPGLDNVRFEMVEEGEDIEQYKHVFVNYSLQVTPRENEKHIKASLNHGWNEITNLFEFKEDFLLFKIFESDNLIGMFALNHLQDIDIALYTTMFSGKYQLVYSHMIVYINSLYNKKQSIFTTTCRHLPSVESLLLALNFEEVDFFKDIQSPCAVTYKRSSPE